MHCSTFRPYNSHSSIGCYIYPAVVYLLLELLYFTAVRRPNYRLKHLYAKNGQGEFCYKTAKDISLLNKDGCHENSFSVVHK